MNSTNYPATIAGTVGRLVAGEVQSATFPRAPLGRRGLDEDHVRAFLKQVEMDLTQILNERAGLADEVARLRRHVAAGSAAELPPEDAHIQAVRILAQAQQTADAYVADAERYSRELAGEARRHRQEILADATSRAELILQEAHERAAIAADDAARAIPAAASGSPGERRDMEREIAYLRTYSDVYRRHLRAYLEALLRNVEEWEQSERRSVPSHPALPPLPG
ncbi:MAG TPA: DivIVA domain-containing protein [Streptosporangiaceae bacterium]